MAFKYTGDATLGVGLTVETPKPLDNRTVVDNLEELYSIPERYAYQGMTVSNIDNGNIYMLIDKSKIKYKEGWKASYESIQIIACTEAEYKEWSANTTEDFKPIDENKTYLHAETYYYIYEDSLDDNQFYLSAEWGKKIEEQLKQKALNTTVVQIRNDLDQTIQNLSKYATLEELTANYAPKADLDLEDPESLLSKALSNHYTKQETDDIFVTKESLRGEGMEGDDFVFVTKKQYDEDQQAIQSELDKTLKVDGDGSLESITVGQIKSPVIEGEDQLVVDVKSDGLFVGKDQFAMMSDVPNLVTLTEEEYLKLVEDGTLEPDTYYYVYDVTNDAKVYITKEYLDQNYHTTHQYQSWVATNYYSKSQIDEIVAGLQKLGSYVTTEDIKAYYTSQQVDEKFLTKENAQSTYATQQSLTELSGQIAEEYVTKDSLRGDSPETGDDDFIFVTQNKYQQDQTAASQEFSTKLLKSEQIETSDITIQKIVEKEVQQGTTEESPGDIVIEQTIESSVNLTTEDNRLLASGKQVALIEEVPKLVCLPQTDYDNLVENNKTENDTYYCTYGEKDIQDTGYVRSEYLTEKYYTKAEVEALIQEAVSELQKKIDAIQPGSGSASVDESNEQLIF